MIEANHYRSDDPGETARREHGPREETGSNGERLYRSERKGPGGEVSAYGQGREMTFREDYARNGDYLGRHPGDVSFASRFDEEYFIDEREAFGTGCLGGDGEMRKKAKNQFGTRVGDSENRGGALSDQDRAGTIWRRAKDAVASLFGAAGGPSRELDGREDEPACYRGYAPKGYTRADERIRMDVCDRLSDDPYVDATEIVVDVHNSVVRLVGTVPTEAQRRRAERSVSEVSGVAEVRNNLGASVIAL